MRILSLLLFLVIMGLMLMKFNEVKMAKHKDFQEQKTEALNQYEINKGPIEEYKKQRARSLDEISKPQQ